MYFIKSPGWSFWYVFFFNQLFLVLALVVVPAISVAVRKFGRFLRELSHKTQAAAATAASIAEVSLCT